MSQSQATGDVAIADLNRRIGSDNDYWHSSIAQKFVGRNDRAVGNTSGRSYGFPEHGLRRRADQQAIAAAGRDGLFVHGA